MGNYCNNCSRKKNKVHPHNKSITLLLIGLNYSGKTTIAKRLSGEKLNTNTLETIGFSVKNLHYSGFSIKLYDIGGNLNVRELWDKYFIDTHGIIYVVDASESDRLQESKIIFAKTLSHINIAGKPVLILANKQDKENAIDELEVVHFLNVEQVVNKYRCLTRVETCSALSSKNSVLNRGLIRGFRWLINIIIENFKIINDRVQCDMYAYSFQIRKEKEEWMKKLPVENCYFGEDDNCIVNNGNISHPQSN